MHPAIPIFFVFTGCCSNVVMLELLVRESPSCGTIVTFMQFFFIALEGFVRATKFFTKKAVIPLKAYVVMVFLFFMTSVINNYAFAFKISMPLHLIFRSGSLVANLILGIIILRKRYTFTKCFSVFMITVGISLATIASVDAKIEDGDITEEQKEYNWNDFLSWSFGILLLTVALFLSALMGLYQETVYKNYGKHPSEALFYNHALPLPFFLFFYADLLHHVNIFNRSAPLLEGIIPIPIMWIYILGNVITQFVCIKSVFVLTTECPSLTVTLVVTLRKFISLVFSIFYFSNPFTLQHWIGTVLVFGGTALFTDLHGSLMECLSSKDAKKKKYDDSSEIGSYQKIKSQ